MTSWSYDSFLYLAILFMFLKNFWITVLYKFNPKHYSPKKHAKRVKACHGVCECICVYVFACVPSLTYSLLKCRQFLIQLITSFWLTTNAVTEEGSCLSRTHAATLIVHPLTPPHTHTHTQMIYLGAFDCALIATAIKWKDKVNKGTKPYHLDNKSPHVSRIFSAHSLETSPDPLSNGSSLSGHREKRSQMFQIYQDVANFTRGHFVLRCLMECLL